VGARLKEIPLTKGAARLTALNVPRPESLRSPFNYLPSGSMADNFEVISNDDSSITIVAPWGTKSTISSWHLVEERKLQLTRWRVGDLANLADQLPA